MKFDPLHPSQSAIIEILAQNKGLTIQELHSLMTNNHSIQISTQNLYRTVSQMAEKHMLFREKGKLYLNLNWLKHVTYLMKSAELHYLMEEDQALALPDTDGQTLKYSAKSLKDLDPIWDHLILKLTAQTDSRHWYEYGSHLYHVLGLPSEELAFYQNLQAAGVHHHLLVGSTHVLDTYGAKRLKGMVGVSQTDTPPFPEEGYILLVCGNYVIESVLPAHINDHLTSIYSTVSSMEDFDTSVYRDIFAMKSTCTISIQKNASKAQKLRTILASYVS